MGPDRAVYIQMELCTSKLWTEIVTGLYEDLPRVWRMFRVRISKANILLVNG